MGSDMIDIRRIEQSLARFGPRFEKRVFTEAEQKKAYSRQKAGMQTIAATYAKRFAAKEACSKALGTGLRQGVYWRDMEVVSQPSGAPAIQLSGGALAHLKRLVPQGMNAAIHITMTDEYPYAQAQVVIEAVAAVS